MTQTTNQIEPVRNQNDIPEDEIDLVDLVAILWRRRWLMVGVFAVIVGLAAAYCFIATPKYEITAQISPGITGFDKGGIPISHWSAKDIQNWFSQKGYLELMEGVLEDNVKPPEIDASNSKDSNLVNISFDWPDLVQGKQLLKSSIDFLAQRGNKSIQQLIGNRRAYQAQIFRLIKDKEHIPLERERLKDEVQKTHKKMAVDKQTLEYAILKLNKDLEQIPIQRTRIDNQIEKDKNKIKVLNTKLSSIEKNKLLSKQAATNIKVRIDRVNSNTEDLIQLRKKSFDGDSDKLALLMYSNIVQQNISFAISLQSRLEGLEKEMNLYNDQESAKAKELDDTNIEIRELRVKRDQEMAMKEEKIKKNILKLNTQMAKIINDAEIKIEELKVKRNQELSMKKDKLTENIDTLKTKLTTLTPLEVNQLPFSSLDSIKPAKIKILAFAIVLGGFFAVLAAFLIEFWYRNKERIRVTA